MSATHAPPIRTGDANEAWWQIAEQTVGPAGARQNSGRVQSSGTVSGSPGGAAPHVPHIGPAIQSRAF
jgi:hypothetical protein